MDFTWWMADADTGQRDAQTTTKMAFVRHVKQVLPFKKANAPKRQS
jgi:hypothetical protein